MTKEVVLALFVTSMALALIFALDYLADLEATDEAVDKALRTGVQALAILIGFSWEKAFDDAVVSITAAVTVVPRSLMRLVLAVVLAGVVIPAWRFYILPIIYDFKSSDMEEKEVAEPAAGSFGEAAKPLLGSGKMKRSSTRFTGLSAHALHQKCQSYKLRIRELERSTGRKATLKAKAGLEAVGGTVAAFKRAHARAATSAAKAGSPGKATNGCSTGAAVLDSASRNEVLERRNAELEAALGGLSEELAELQRLADLLT